jgi:hypothetical protein
MAGRNTPSPELDQAAVWIASAFERFGLAAGGEGRAFIQRYPLEGTRLDVARSRLMVAGVPPLALGSDALWILGSQRAAASRARTVVIAGGPDRAMLDSARLAGATALVVAPPTPVGALAAHRHPGRYR